jgi:hypothetical protein
MGRGSVVADFNVVTEIGVQSVIGEIREAFRVHGFVRVSVKAGKKRSLPQNDCSFAWYEQLARELREDDTRGWRRFCKLHFGVPILRAEDEDFRAVYDKAVRPLDYERKLALMDYLPVTSLMTKAQKSKYLDDMRDHFWKEHRVQLSREAA